MTEIDQTKPKQTLQKYPSGWRKPTARTWNKQATDKPKVHKICIVKDTDVSQDLDSDLVTDSGRSQLI